MTQPEQQLDAQPLLSLYARMRRRSALLIWAALGIAVLLAAIAGLIQQAAPLPAPDYGKVGVHMLLDDGRNQWDESLWSEHIAYAAQMTGANGIIVQVIRGDDLKPARWQKFIDACASAGRTPVLRLAAVFDREKNYWLPPFADADGSYHTVAGQYADFLAAIDWHGLTPHVILLNEPNNGVEWGGSPDAAAYARFVMDTVPTLRAAVPNIKILNAAFDLYSPNTGSAPFANGLRYIDANTFMDTMRAAQPPVFQQFDFWNSHAYPSGFKEPPWKQEFHFDATNDGVVLGGTPTTGIYNRGINSYAWDLWKLATFGVTNPKVMVTETGWRYRNVTESLDAGEDYPIEEVAYSYLDVAMRGNTAGLYTDVPASDMIPWLQDERVVAVAVFALDGVPREWAHTNLLKMNDDGTIAATTMQFDILASYQKP